MKQMVEEITKREKNNIEQKLIHQEKAERLNNNHLKCLEISEKIVNI